MTMRALSGLSEIVNQYDGFILDLWGVVHDGIKPFPWTVSTLQELKRAKRKVWLLSNAPRRASVVIAHLARMGVPRDLYGGIVTSGETAHDALQDELLKKWGRRCFRFGGYESLCDGLDMSFADTPDQADFVLVEHVYDIMPGPDSAWKPDLRTCAARKLPLLCANPDKIVHVGDNIVICAGTLADIYEKMGGDVTYFGKPHRAVYARCLKEMGAKRVLAIGDGMPTDIAGAMGAGIDSALVVSGIHRDELFPPSPPAKRAGEGRGEGARDAAPELAQSTLGPTTPLTPPLSRPQGRGEREKGGNENHLQDFFVKYPWRPTYSLDGLIW